jgi:hypothetical protein
MAPKAAEKAPAKKSAPAKTGDAGKKKKKVAKVESYKLYIYKVRRMCLMFGLSGPGFWFELCFGQLAFLYVPHPTPVLLLGSSAHPSIGAGAEAGAP